MIMKVRDAIKMPGKDGWILDRTRGDHRQYVHAVKPGTVTVPGHPGASNWAAYVPDLPGCVTTGKTLDDTRRLIGEAIEFHIEGIRLRGEPVPSPSSRAEEIEVEAA